MYLQETSGTYTPIISAKAEGKAMALYGMIEEIENANTFRTLKLTWDSSSNKSVVRNIQNHVKAAWIDTFFSKIALPKAWVVEGVQAPTDNAIKIAKRITLHLWSQFDLKPYDVQASIEGGIMLSYRKDKKYVVVEIDNEDDINCVGGIGKAISFSKSLDETKLDDVGAFFLNANS